MPSLHPHSLLESGSCTVSIVDQSTIYSTIILLSISHINLGDEVRDMDDEHPFFIARPIGAVVVPSDKDDMVTTDKGKNLN